MRVPTRCRARALFTLTALLFMTIDTTRAQTPNWQVNPAGFESSMTLIGRVLRQGTPMGNPADLLAAFVGDEVRGVTSPVDVGGQPLFFLTVFANTDGKTVTFKTYDAENGVVHRAVEIVAFQTNGIEGTVADPFNWTADLLDSGAPTWVVNAADYVASMTVTAVLSIENEEAVAEDLLAAFVGEEVRGVATAVELNQQVVFFLTLHANQSGEPVHFRIYDASTQTVYEVAETLSFEANASHGSAQEPLVLTASDALSTAVTPLPSTNGLPERYRLEPNFPNPFNPSTRISYALPEAAHVVLTVNDLLGRTVAVVVDAHHPAGRYEVAFEAGGLPSGIYLYRLQAGPYTRTLSMLLLK